MPRKPSGPRQGDEFGFDPAAEMRAMVKRMVNPPERDGRLVQIAQAGKVPHITPHKKRLIDASVSIRADEPDELLFQHTVLTQTCLPAKEQPSDVLVWQRQQGRAVLLIEAGKAWNPDISAFVQLGLPFGAQARLILMHLNSEAMRRGTPHIPVGDSLTGFIAKVQGRTPTGVEIRRFKRQLSALSASTVRMAITSGNIPLQINTQIVGAFDLWFPVAENQRVVWPTELCLSLDYFESLRRHAVPLDDRAIAALKNSAMALDMYCWLAQRLWRIPDNKPQFVPWASLYEQFGQGYNLIRQFRAFFKKQLKHVKAVYQDARIEVDDRKGIYLWQSQPPMPKRLLALPSTKFLELKAEEK